MKSNGTVWYLPGDDDRPNGPHSSDYVLGLIEARDLSESTLCWRQGMQDWLPLSECEPFADAFARLRAEARKRTIRRAVVVALLLCLAGAGIGAYLLLRDPPQIANAKELIEAGLYDEAADVLESYLRTRPADFDGAFLMAVAKLKGYATADVSGQMGYGILRHSGGLDEAQQIFSRVLKAHPEWKPRVKEAVSEAMAQVPMSIPEGLNRAFGIARLQDRFGLEDPTALASGLLERVTAADAKRHWRYCQPVAAQILDWNPTAGEAIVNWAMGDAAMTDTELDQMLRQLATWVEGKPDLAKTLALQLSRCALGFYEDGREQSAARAFKNALELDPEAGQGNETLLLLSIELTEPDESKLSRCLQFIQDRPQSESCGKVLTIVVRDAVAVYDRHRGWQKDKTEPYLRAAVDCAKVLTKHHVSQAISAADSIHELARRLAQDKQISLAIELADSLKDLEIDAALENQIVTDLATWRKPIHGTLPDELIALAERVDKELKIIDLTVPATLHSLAADPRSVHVLRVADGCTVSKFTSQQVEMLKAWVAGGGVLWVNNDVLKLFGIQYTSHYMWSGAKECRRGIEPTICPILTGCDQAVVTKHRPAAQNLQSSRVWPLLTSSQSEEKFTYWSLVQYGDGWISDAKTVDLSQYDGARFWLNFRLFCLGWDIPGAPPTRPIPPAPVQPPPQGSQPGNRLPSPTLPSPPAPGPGPIERITTVDALRKALADPARDTIWVALSRRDVDTDTLRDLRDWLLQSKTVWVETDLVTVWGLDRSTGVECYKPPARNGLASRPQTQSLSGRGMIRFELGPDGLLLKAHPQMLTKHDIVCLLGFQTGERKTPLAVVSALWHYRAANGSGTVVFRPMEFKDGVTMHELLEP